MPCLPTSLHLYEEIINIVCVRWKRLTARPRSLGSCWRWRYGNCLDLHLQQQYKFGKCAKSKLDGPYDEAVCRLCFELMKTFDEMIKWDKTLASFTGLRNKRREVEAAVLAVVSVGLMFTAISVILSIQGKYSVVGKKIFL